TLRTKGVRLPREAERRMCALMALQQRAGRPIRPRRLRLRDKTIDGLESAPAELSDVAESVAHDLHGSSRLPRIGPWRARQGLSGLVVVLCSTGGRMASLFPRSQ